VKRIIEIDALRGVAILMMVIYHFIFDIRFLGFASFDLYSLPLVLFQRSTGSLFILLAGVSIVLSESRNTEGYMHHVKRAVLLGAVALAISLATWIYPHDAFITFGIVHFLALSTFIAPFFFRFGKLNAVLGIAFIAMGLVAGGIETDSGLLFWLGLPNANYTALDYYPMLPWFGIILFGLSIGQTIFKNGEPVWKPMPATSPLSGFLSFLGKNSLTIYLIHQPILIGLMLGMKALGIV
jgi:uncharacterized membrane protein